MRRWVAAALLCATSVLGAPGAHAAAPRTHWVGTWAAALQAGPPGVAGTTYRDVVHTSVGGSTLRIRVSNVFGTRPLAIGAASVASRGSVRTVTFAGGRGVVLAPGRDLYSDPVALRVGAGQDLAVSLYVTATAGPSSSHPFAQATSFLAYGNHAGDAGSGAFTRTTTAWWWLQGVDVGAAPGVGTVVAVGDSITDGFTTTRDGNDRWPDVLARRLSGRRPVVDVGLTGNAVTLDRSLYGVSLLHRLQRDVLAESGVETVILLEGINDIGYGGVAAPAIERADTAIVARLHAAGIRVLGATLTPAGGSTQAGPNYSTPFGLAQRDALNAWIRTAGAFDAVVDFDAAVRDPADHERLAPRYDSGDHLHPNDAGQRAMGNAIRPAQLADNARRLRARPA